MPVCVIDGAKQSGDHFPSCLGSKCAPYHDAHNSTTVSKILLEFSVTATQYMHGDVDFSIYFSLEGSLLFCSSANQR